MARFRLLAAIAALLLPTLGPARAEQGFAASLEALWPDAERAGITRATFDAATAGLTPDPQVLALTRKQPELAKPTGRYLAAQVTDARVETGRQLLARYKDTLAAIETSTGVPAAIVVAIWGLETNYGTASGSKDVLRSIATLAASGYRPTLYRPEFVAALTMLQNGDARREDLRGSWAGAMGQPQFMPSSYLKYAVDQDGDGRRDIWTDVPDALGSIARFVAEQGWKAGRPWGVEVKRPRDLGRSHGTADEWEAAGLTTVRGGALPPGSTTLYFPAGETGPSFLVTGNFEVLKTYNFSDSYVLSVGLLADRIEGRGGFVGVWPTEPPIGREDRIALQSELVRLGLPVDNREGRISLALRDSIRQAQARVGQPPDGNPTKRLLDALRRGADKAE